MPTLTAARARLRERGAQPMTRDEFMRNLALYCHEMVIAPEGWTAEDIADLIRLHQLDAVLCGTHLGKTCTFSAAYFAVFGERLK